ncbi:hypothetical protein F6R98_08655 [Candidatus Methylospira mobilis]|uniref:Uncharacterized protein n=1 Tax=Candidatus Methylospira mobilis TaxID=1808979 RepID=A0A5Q0BKP2_9GAMM|nr:hypothetical protein [Candidatus Methylospira mobilis]QFY42687.1 hypothetical protein F6R98_08655 [Candidatus Methylospira mobilis]WNV04196.1 hypothetical protein RP726_17550 [Candidatus Methylospira mobilis]
MDINKAKTLLTDADRDGSVKIHAGVWLLSQAAIVSEQQGWSEFDASYNKDFTTAPYWIVSDNGNEPVGVANANELQEVIR